MFFSFLFPFRCGRLSLFPFRGGRLSLFPSPLPQPPIQHQLALSVYMRIVFYSLIAWSSLIPPSETSSENLPNPSETQWFRLLLNMVAEMWTLPHILPPFFQVTVHMLQEPGFHNWTLPQHLSPFFRVTVHIHAHVLGTGLP